MNLAFVKKLASQNRGVKYLLIAVNLFSRFQRLKTKYAKDALQAFKKVISQKKTAEKLGGNFKNFCKEKNLEVYSIRSETKAAFVERAIQSL